MSTKLKNLLAENMRRFKTKNLDQDLFTEQQEKYRSADVNDEVPQIKKIFIKHYVDLSAKGTGRPSWQHELSPKTRSRDSGESFVEFDDGTKLQYPYMWFTSYVSDGTYEGIKLTKFRKPIYNVSVIIDGIKYETSKHPKLLGLSPAL